MAIEIGRTLKRRREWARLTQQELVDHTGIERSSSYIGAIERGNTSPTLDELERLARYFRVTVIELLQEAMDESVRRGSASAEAAEVDDRLARSYQALDEADQDLALEFMELLVKHKKRR